MPSLVRYPHLDVKDKLLAANSDQTARTRFFTGKPARFLDTGWTQEWARPEAPEPLPAPLQTHLVGDYIQRLHTAIGGAGAWRACAGGWS